MELLPGHIRIEFFPEGILIPWSVFANRISTHFDTTIRRYSEQHVPSPYLTSSISE
jgi:hypothetical protein